MHLHLELHRNDYIFIVNNLQDAFLLLIRKSYISNAEVIK